MGSLAGSCIETYDCNAAFSFEQVFHDVAQTSGNADYTLLFRSNNPDMTVDQEMVQELAKPRLERYIGVIYRPDTERGNSQGVTSNSFF
jgi:hypothetical protein